MESKVEVNINYIKGKDAKGICTKEFDWGTIRANEIELKFDSLSSKRKLKKDVKRIIKYRKWLYIKRKVDINIYNYDEENILIVNFADLVKAIIEADNLKDLYNRVYVLACDYLDLHFYSKNVCDFCNDKCGGKKDTDSLTGCCHYFKGKMGFGPLSPRFKISIM